MFVESQVACTQTEFCSSCPHQVWAGQL